MLYLNFLNFEIILDLQESCKNSNEKFEIKRLLGRKAVANLDSVLKNRDIICQLNVLIVKDMVFSVVMYRCESWTIKKAERGKTDSLELWCWRRPLESPLVSKEIKLVNPKGNQP